MTPDRLMTRTEDLPPIRIGARRSPLARAQADQVAARLMELGWRCEYVPIITHGDTDRRELTQIGGTGVFTSVVREALLSGKIDVGVHSLKDLPTEPAPGLQIAAVLEREDTRDVLVGLELDQLLVGSGPDGTPVSVGTGAPRRAVQLIDLARRHHVRVDVRPVRGNVGTRLELVRSGQFDAVVLAAAGLRRLGLLSESDGPEGAVWADGIRSALLGPEVMLPAAGQGAIACEVADSLDWRSLAAMTRLDHALTRAEVLAERTFLNVLEAGCTAPVGARAIVKSVRDTSTDLTLTAVIGRTVGDKLAVPNTSRSSTSFSTSPTSPSDRRPNQGLFSNSSGSIDAELFAAEVIKVEGHGSSAQAADVGRRLARQVLAQ